MMNRIAILNDQTPDCLAINERDARMLGVWAILYDICPGDTIDTLTDGRVWCYVTPSDNCRTIGTKLLSAWDAEQAIEEEA